MALNDTQKRLLEGIQNNLRWGDVVTIVKKSKFSRQAVNNVLNLNTDDFNEDIVRIAIDIISERTKSEKKLLEKLDSHSDDNNNTQNATMQAAQ